MDHDSDAPAAELPLLGEAFAVEFANTRYEAGWKDLDFLADSAAMTVWFDHAPAAAGLTVPSLLTSRRRREVQRIRDATRRLLCETADGVPLSVEAARLLNEATSNAAGHVRLDTTGARATWEVRYTGADSATFIASVAARCVLFLGGEDAARVRRCATPTCSMLFVQRHRSRRFCDASCAHGGRQARYYRATKHRERT